MEGALTHLVLLVAVALAATPAVRADDLRLQLVRSQLEGNAEVALREVDRLLSEQPEQARELGLSYLRARLLETTGRQDAVNQALLRAITDTPPLAAYSFYRMALEQERRGHPETAAGLVARVVAGGGFPQLLEATRLLTRSLAQGGDCRLLGGITEQNLARAARRQVRVARALCALRQGDAQRARQGILALLREDRGDEPALEAAELAAAHLLAQPDRELDLEVGLALNQHRDFERSNAVLDRVPLTSGKSALEIDALYARARNEYWLGRYRDAAARFGDLAGRMPTPERRADALYQQARSLELVNDWSAASATFRRTYMADPRGEWGGLGLLSALRLEWRLGSEATALSLFQLLTSARHARDMAGRAALFLAASDLAQGRGDRAETWLDQAAGFDAVAASELSYWRGRRAEITGDGPAAVGHYLDALRANDFHPFALAARERLHSPSLESVAREQARRLAASGRPDDLRSAWLLLGDGSPRSAQVVAALALRLARDPRAATFLRLAPVPIEDWVLWQRPLNQPEERLLGLGLWQEGAPAVARFFPPSTPMLAYTAALRLKAVGELQQALLLAEVIDRQRPPEVPDRLLPVHFRELLYPLGFREQLLAAAGTHQVEPWLLAAIVREESRFDPQALSNASARGLTQFTQPTARRFAARIGKNEIAANDLYRPEVSLALGAAYLAQLGEDFGGFAPAMVAAYNAGEDQARLWQSYCFTRDPAEYLSKVGFRQTRAYVVKVLSSEAQYRDIYARASP